MSDRFLVKVIPPHGYSVYRLEVSRRHLYCVAGVLVAVALLALAGFFWDVHHLRAIAAEQRRQLAAVGRQARTLDERLSQIQRQNARIRRMLGLKPQAAELASRGGSETTEMRLAALDRIARHVNTDERQLVQQAAKVAAEHKAEAIARARALAAVPALMPVDGPIVSGFGYRTYPDREFHEGVDIAADYGQAVATAADGYVAFAGWDGGYGIKVDIDHGNGYHTWYAHLSRLLVHAGEAVKRGEEIGLVGATGFATGPHLHYQVMLDGRAIDPTPFLHGVPRDVVASLK